MLEQALHGYPVRFSLGLDWSIIIVEDKTSELSCTQSMGIHGCIVATFWCTPRYGLCGTYGCTINFAVNTDGLRHLLYHKLYLDSSF